VASRGVPGFDGGFIHSFDGGFIRIGFEVRGVVVFVVNVYSVGSGFGSFVVDFLV
jgi:hypothetical protein